MSTKEITALSEAVTDRVLRNAAQELNRVLKLEPQIDSNLKGDLLLSAIQVASKLIWEEDKEKLSKETLKLLEQLDLVELRKEEVNGAEATDDKTNAFSSEQSIEVALTDSVPKETEVESEDRQNDEVEDASVEEPKVPTDPRVKQYIIELLKEHKYKKKDIMIKVCEKFPKVNKNTLSVFLTKAKKDPSKLGVEIQVDGSILYV